MNRQSENSFMVCVNHACEMLASSIGGLCLDDFTDYLGKMIDDPESVVQRLVFLRLAEVKKNVISLSRGMNDIFSFNFPQLAGRYYYYPESGSTMTEAVRLLSEGAHDFTVVAAESQNAGRGRNGRQWVSSPGGIYCSIILRPDIKPELCFRINFMVCAVIVSFLRDVYGVDAACKWPNDILAGGGKIAGMISDAVIEGSAVKYVVIGLGLNVNNDLPSVGQPVSSIKKILGREVPRKDFFAGMIKRLENAYAEFFLTDWIAETRRFSATIGRKVTIEKPGKIFSGEAIDVDDDGLLLVKLENSDVIKISSGDCVHSFI